MEAELLMGLLTPYAFPLPHLSDWILLPPSLASFNLCTMDELGVGKSTVATTPAKEEENKEAAMAEKKKRAAEEAILVQPTAKKPAETKADEEVVAETKDKEEEKVEMVENDVVSAEEKMATITTTEIDPVNDDDAKIVKAIEETIVAVSSSNPQPQEQKESEAKAAPKTNKRVNKEVKCEKPEEVSIWGVPLLADERSDVILLKFLRAKDFKISAKFKLQIISSLLLRTWKNWNNF